MKYAENCVYAVKVKNGFKVGFTSRLGDRLAAFQRHNGCACYPCALITGLSRASARKIEIEIHERLMEFCVEPETFDAPQDAVISAFPDGVRVLK